MSPIDEAKAWWRPNSTKQRLPPESNIRLAARQIFLSLQNMEVHYHIYRSVLSHINSINILIVSYVVGSTVSRAGCLSIKFIVSYSLYKFNTLHNFKIFLITCFDQYNHHQVFKIITEEPAVLLLLWLWLLIYGPLYAHVYSKWRVIWSSLCACVIEVSGYVVPSMRMCIRKCPVVFLVVLCRVFFFTFSYLFL
jgi:hypothetical protein